MLVKLLNLDNLLLSLIILFVSTALTHSEEVFIEIDNPRFSEKGLSDKTYEIKAEKGLKSDNELKLFAIEGKFKTVKDTFEKSKEKRCKRNKNLCAFGHKYIGQYIFFFSSGRLPDLALNITKT